MSITTSLNVIFSALVVVAIVGGLSWSIVLHRRHDLAEIGPGPEWKPWGATSAPRAAGALRSTDA